jgi:hypothetical protein
MWEWFAEQKMGLFLHFQVVKQKSWSPLYLRNSGGRALMLIVKD